MLNKLTEEQEKLMHQVKQEWLDRFFVKKEKTNRTQAAKGIEWLYSLAKLKKPIIVFTSSPYAAQLAVNYAKLLINAYNTAIGGSAQVGAQAGAQVGAQVRGQVRAQVGDQAGAQVGAQVRDQVWAQVWAQVGDQVGAQVRDQVWAQAGAQVGGQKITPENFSNIGCYDFGWVGFCDFFQRINLVTNNKYDTFLEFIKSNVYDMIQLDGLCVVCELPTTINRNSDNNLHSTKSNAIEWSDGYGLKFVNGRAISDQLFNEIISNKFSFNDFKKIENEDEKGIIMTMIKENKGNEGLLKFLGAVEVDKKTIKHTSNYSETIRLLKTKEKYSFLQNSKGELNQPYAWVEMKCPSTGTTYLIDTCPTFNDAIECVSWHRPKQVPSSIKYQWMSAN